MIDDFERAATVSSQAGDPLRGASSRLAHAGLIPIDPSARETSDRIDHDLGRCRGFSRHGQYREAASLLNEDLCRLGEMGDPFLRARLLGRLGMIESQQGYTTSALGHCREAYEVLRETGAEEETGLLELSLGVLASQQGRNAEAADFLECALFSFRRLEHREGIARAMSELGSLLARGSRWKEAREYLEGALALSEESGDPLQIAGHSLALGSLQCCAGEWVAATQLLNRALLLFRENGDEFGGAQAHLRFGDLMLRRRQDHMAESHLARALEIAQKNGYVGCMIAAQVRSAEFHTRQGSPSRARALLAAAGAASSRCGADGLLLCELRRGQAQTHLALGEFEEAVAAGTEAASRGEACADLRLAATSLKAAATAIFELGRHDLAYRMLARAAEMLGETPDVLEGSLTRWELARLLAAVSETPERLEGVAEPAAEAVKLFESASARLLELDLPGQAIDVLLEMVDVRLAQGNLAEAGATADRSFELVERLADPERRQRVQQVRAVLEERSIDLGLSESVEFQLLRDLADGSRDNPTVSLAQALEAARRLSRSDRAALAFESEPGHLTLEVTVGFAEAEIAALRALCARLLQEQEEKPRLHLLLAPRVDRRCQDLAALATRIGTAAAIPLPGAGGRGALLYLDRLQGSGPDVRAGAPLPRSSAGSYSDSELRQCSLLAALLAYLLPAGEARPGDSERAAPRIVLKETPAQGSFITVDSQTLRIMEHLPKIADAEAGILITGETGTGKGLLTLLIHRASRRAAGPFVPINCAALPESLLESELYGHVRGAFTGAIRDKVGLFEEACGGTILLDEVDKTNLAVQAKLLHVLDRREIRPVGSNRSRPVNVRVICATNTDLGAAISGGRFLEDLFYRLNDFSIHIPPLRDRRCDVPVLVRHFLHLYAKEMGRSVPPVSADTMRILTEQDWRGNVRELGKVMKRLMVLVDEGDVIGPSLLPREFLDRGPQPENDPGRSLRSEVRSLEARLIRRTLAETNGNKSETSRRLQMSYPSLLAKIKQYRLDEGADSEGNSSR